MYEKLKGPVLEIIIKSFIGRVSYVILAAHKTSQIYKMMDVSLLKSWL